VCGGVKGGEKLNEENESSEKEKKHKEPVAVTAGVVTAVRATMNSLPACLHA
jgi:hypothetical protein